MTRRSPGRLRHGLTMAAAGWLALAAACTSGPPPPENTGDYEKTIQRFRKDKDEFLRTDRESPVALAARATFARLDSVNRYALIYRLGRLKTEAGRARAIERFVQMLAQGRTPHPLPGSAADRAGAVLARAGASAADSPPRASKRAKTSKRVKVSKRAKASKRAKVSRGGE